MTERVTNIDFKILNGINKRLSCGTLDRIMPKISFLGNGGLIWFLAGGMLFVKKQYRIPVFIMLLALLSGVVVGNLFIKNLVARDRPCWLNKTFPMRINVPKDYSFPSCHTMSSFIAADVLYQTNLLFGYAAFALAGLIAFSRMYLYVHYPSDVIGGAVIGVTLGTSVWHIACGILM
jgi:undecaprenyl-diphosphatase